jgi:hypothetical protein
MELHLGPVPVSDASFPEDPDADNEPWRPATVPGFGLPTATKGRVHVVGVCYTTEALNALRRSDWWHQMQRTACLASAALVEVSCPARSPVPWNPGLVFPAQASTLRHAFRAETWARFTSTQDETAGEPHEFGLILTLRDAIFQTQMRTFPRQRWCDWVMLVFPDHASPQTKGQDLFKMFKAVQEVMRTTSSVPMVIELASAQPELTGAGGMYAGSTVFNHLNLTTWPHEEESGSASFDTAQSPYRLVRDAGSLNGTEIFGPAAMLLHPQLAYTLSVMPIGHTSLVTWIHEAIAWCQRKLDKHLVKNPRNPHGWVECCIAGIVPVPFTNTAFKDVADAWRDPIIIRYMCEHRVHVNRMAGH